MLEITVLRLSYILHLLHVPKRHLITIGHFQHYGKIQIETCDFSKDLCYSDSAVTVFWLIRSHRHDKSL